MVFSGANTRDFVELLDERFRLRPSKTALFAFVFSVDDAAGETLFQLRQNHLGVAVRANAMAEIGVFVLFKVSLEAFPIIPIRPDVFTIHADGKNLLQ